MPAVFGASVSSNRFPCCERLVICFSHELITAIKFAFEHLQNQNISSDVEKLKQLITLSKKHLFNGWLRAEKRPRQDVPRRFGSTHDRLKRCVDAEQDVSRVIDGSDQESINKAIGLFDGIFKHKSTYPSFDATVNCFVPLHHAHTMVDASDTHALMLVLPLHEELKRKLGLKLTVMFEESIFLSSSK